MIAVLADDLTGAAEIGGVACRYGLRAEIQTEFNPESTAELIVIDTNTRARSAGEAARVVESIAVQCRRAGIEQIFKKVDSVLRGPVLAELAALLAALGCNRALLVPANPSLGRTISQGQYRINGQLLHQTDFANDPDYPATTSAIKTMLLQRSEGFASDRWPVQIFPPAAKLPVHGIIVGETIDPDDTARWAGRLAGGTIPAGAAEFFAAFLVINGYGPVTPPPEFSVSGPALFVSGSTSAASRLFCRQCEAAGRPVLRMPPELFQPSPAAPAIDGWSQAVVQALQTHAQVMVAIDRPLHQSAHVSQLLTDYLSEVVKKTLAASPVEQLFVEGGATAAALVQKMGWQRFKVKRELVPGVVTMQIEGKAGPAITLKPGSYPWPAEVSGLLTA